MKTVKSYFKIILLLASLIQFSCHKEPLAHISNSMDDTEWLNKHTITSEKSYTDKYSSKIDSNSTYSFGYVNNFFSISDKKINKIDASCWIYFEKEIESTVFVVQITKNDSNIIWEAFDCKEIGKNTNQWINIHKIVNLNGKYDPYYKIGVYLWSPKGEVCYMDDLEINFY